MKQGLCTLSSLRSLHLASLSSTVPKATTFSSPLPSAKASWATSRRLQRRRTHPFPQQPNLTPAASSQQRIITHILPLFSFSFTARNYKFSSSSLDQTLRQYSTTTSMTSTSSPPLGPPVAQKIPHFHSYHGKTATEPDHYHWLKSQIEGVEKPQPILDYLIQENAYFKAKTQSLQDEAEVYYKEILSRIKETDSSVPVFKKPYYYFRSTVKGLDYPIYYRSVNPDLSSPETLLDQNLQKLEYQSLGDFKVSPNHEILAYSMDTDGSELYTIHFKDLKTGLELTDRIPKVSNSIVWSKDSKCIYYTVMDHIHRPFKLYRHSLGGEVEKDELLFHECDEKFMVGISSSASGEYIWIDLVSSLTTEVHYLDASDPKASPVLFRSRQVGVKYSVEHRGEEFLILTNEGGKYLNFKLYSTPIQKRGGKSADVEDWEEVIPYDPLVHIEEIQPFKNFIVLHERTQGLTRMRILTCASPTRAKCADSHVIPFEEEVHSVQSIGFSQQNYESNVVRFSYASILSNTKVMQFLMDERRLELLKETEIPSATFRPEEYTVKRVYVPIPSERRIAAPFETPVPDAIPITIIYKNSLFKGDGSNPCLLYGYGSYGISIDPTFSSSKFTLIDRGFVYAIAHIRGGGECGRAWYETGKFHHKANTFYDFIDCAEYLKNSGYTRKEGMAIEGRSAGGLLVGAVLNMKPDLCSLAVAGVPFVDVINTMMDPTIPLTVNEYEEWGNPNELAYFESMMKYSPYDNVDLARPYPTLLVKAGLTDPRVAYWEPAKWVAKLRDAQSCRQLTASPTSSPENEIVFECKMGSGHFGSSGRYAYLKEIALDYAYVVSEITKSASK